MEGTEPRREFSVTFRDDYEVVDLILGANAGRRVARPRVRRLLIFH